MNASFRRLIWALLAVAIGGCGGDRPEHDRDEAHGANEVELFEKNKGVRLPPELQRELGLTTVEVGEKSVTRRVEKIAQVYRAATGGNPAAAVAWLDKAEAKEARAGQNVALRSLPPREVRAGREPERGASRATSPLLPGTLLPPREERETELAAGKLVWLDASSSAAPGKFEALIEFKDTEGRFAVGASLLATFTAERAHTALAVPESAVIHGAGGAFVYAANGEHFTRTPVKVGATADGWVEITDGLYAGDIVVAKAVDSLWLIELCALKGGSPCCPAPAKKRDE